MTLVIVSSWAVLIAGVYLRVIFRLWNRSYRRRHYRAALTVPVSIAFAGLTRHGVTTELSFSGLSLLLAEPVAAGTRLAIELDLARDRVPIAGVVSRCSADEHGHQIGIEFERILPEYEALLTEEIVKTTLLAPVAPDRSSKEPSRSARARDCLRAGLTSEHRERLFWPPKSSKRMVKTFTSR